MRFATSKVLARFVVFLALLLALAACGPGQLPPTPTAIPLEATATMEPLPTRAASGAVARNPRGPDEPFDPAEPTERKRVHRGGSFLCTDQYCTRYMIGTRGKGEVSTGSGHLGFRCVRSPMRESASGGSSP